MRQSPLSKRVLRECSALPQPSLQTNNIGNTCQRGADEVVELKVNTADMKFAESPCVSHDGAEANSADSSEAPSLRTSASYGSRPVGLLTNSIGNAPRLGAESIDVKVNTSEVELGGRSLSSHSGAWADAKNSLEAPLLGKSVVRRRKPFGLQRKAAIDYPNDIWSETEPMYESHSCQRDQTNQDVETDPGLLDSQGTPMYSESIPVPCAPVTGAASFLRSCLRHADPGHVEFQATISRRRVSWGSPESTVVPITPSKVRGYIDSPGDCSVDELFVALGLSGESDDEDFEFEE